MTQTMPIPQQIVDEWEIRHVVDEIDNAVDAKDWTKCRSYFLNEIYADFSSLAGGEGAHTRQCLGGRMAAQPVRR